MSEKPKVRIGAVSDIHYNRKSAGSMKRLFEKASRETDVLLICGDLTDYGLREEAEVLCEDLAHFLTVPAVGILGNHDFESGTQDVVWQVMEDAGVAMLDGECVEVCGIGIAGVSGFGGGFGPHMLNAWGEPLIKQFVQAAVDETMKLERALSNLQTETRVVMMHYAPIEDTVRGEPEAIFPFLGSSRMEAPINTFRPAAVFHGHAHKGAHEGRTASGVPVYNVAVPVLTARDPNGVPLCIVEVNA